MHFQAAALLIEQGITPQDFEALGQEYDLLAIDQAVLHDPDSAGGDPVHLEAILKGPIAWLPGAVPYGNLWQDIRVSAPARPIKLCPSCFPPKQD